MLGNVGYRNFPTAFSPAALFAASEPGVWYDPSDVANTLWLYNLLTWTEQFDNAAWGKIASTVAANSIAAPNGTLTADTIIENTASGVHGFFRTFTVLPSTAYTTSFYIKAFAGGSQRNVAFFDINATASVTINTATMTQIGSAFTVNIQNVGDGWYRCSYTTTSSSTSGSTYMYLAQGTTTSYTGDGASGVYIWGAQVELGSTATTYQPITTVAAETIARYPLATLYQDIAGTTPVTAPNQPVGMMLSKDKGLVLGPEIVTNGNNETALYSGSGAVNGTLVRGAAPNGGFAAVFTCNAGFLSHQALYQTIAANTPVQISVRMYVPTGSLTTAQLFDATDGSWSGASTTVKDNWVTLTSIRNAKATAWILGMGQIAGQSIGGQVFYVDDLSIKALPGNHATQSTAGSRPTYGIVPATGRRNLVTYSEQFDNAAWAKSNLNVAADVFTAPDGTLTADRFTTTATTSNHRVTSTTITLASGQNCVQSVYIKAGTHSFVQIHDGTSTSYFANFNVSTGVVGTATGCTAVMTDVGNGWYRCSIAMALNAANPILCIGMVTSNTAARNESWAANGTETIQVWGAQLEVNTTATAYQKVVSAFEVTEANVASLSYISFDGIDDFMVTPTITPATDKVQVFAGVRKLSDAAQGAIIELSATTSNFGTFALWGPPFASSGFAFWSRGTVLSSNAFTFTPLSPTSNVITGIGEISTDTSILRLNGVQAATSATDQGTGNFLAFPLYLGRRGGTTFPFNGQMYGLITRFGANLTTTAISRTESWLNNKTGAF